MTYFNRIDDFNFIRWAAAVKQRDHHTCQICGERGVELNSHHLNSWDVHEEDRYSIDNGLTLCKYHHDDFHRIYHRGNNTREQFEEYQSICEALIDAATLNCKVEKATAHLIGLLEDGYSESK
jgi:predicted restriction endonuclease